MAKLANARHEAFARHLAKGRSQVDAYRLAGFEPDTGNACRLLTADDRVARRVDELKSAAARRAEVSIDFVLGGMKKLAKCGDLKVEAKAYEMLAKHLGLFDHVQRIEHSGKVINEHLDLTGLEPEDFARMRDLAEKANAKSRKQD